VATAIAPNCQQVLVGVRPGEKLHEEMITETDSLNTVETDRYYVITPSTPTWSVDDFLAAFNGKRVAEGFRYNSGTNTEWLTVEQLRDQIRRHVDANFTV
jgi:FlaA1/EpsC-like NDP-sugar epimerase